MPPSKPNEFELALETFDFIATVESDEAYPGANPTPKPEQVIHYLAKLDDIARARQYAEQRSGELFLR